MYRRILVPLDGSRLAERILPHVETIAKGTGAEVVLLRVAQIPALGPTAIASPAEARKWAETEQAQAVKYLEGVAKRLKDSGIKSRTTVVLGDPSIEILTAAEEQQVDLIALTSHGVSGISHFDQGSVAAKVVKTSPRPVLLDRAFRRQVRILDEQEVWAIRE